MAEEKATRNPVSKVTSNTGFSQPQELLAPAVRICCFVISLDFNESKERKKEKNSYKNWMQEIRADGQLAPSACGFYYAAYRMRRELFDQQKILQPIKVLTPTAKYSTG